jgi:hypothetical protein
MAFSFREQEGGEVDQGAEGLARAGGVQAQAEDKQRGLDRAVPLAENMSWVTAYLFGQLTVSRGQEVEDASGGEGLEHAAQVLCPLVFGHGARASQG